MCSNKNLSHLENRVKEIDTLFKNYFNSQTQNLTISCDCIDHNEINKRFYKLHLDFSNKY